MYSAHFLVIRSKRSPEGLRCFGNRIRIPSKAISEICILVSGEISKLAWFSPGAVLLLDILCDLWPQRGELALPVSYLFCLAVWMRHVVGTWQKTISVWMNQQCLEQKKEIEFIGLNCRSLHEWVYEDLLIWCGELRENGKLLIPTTPFISKNRECFSLCSGRGIRTAVFLHMAFIQLHNSSGEFFNILICNTPLSWSVYRWI